MSSVNLSFRIHIPYQLQKINPGNIGCCTGYFDTQANRSAVNKLSDHCYLPANEILLSLIIKNKGALKISFSISGTAIELLQEYRPDVIQSFREMAVTGCVDFYAETYYNSLSWLYCKKEFRRQVEKHHELITDLFGTEPSVFRNTELIYSNELAAFIAGMGYKGIFCEGLDRILNGRNPNYTYASPGNTDFAVLLRNVNLSDDIAFRFDVPGWNESPLTADKYAGWLHQQTGDNSIVNLFFDYETFGIHKKANSGIFEFIAHLPKAILANPGWSFLTPAEAIENYYPRDVYNVPKTISWEDKERPSCVSCENMMQNNTLKKIYAIEQKVKDSNIPGALECWGRLQSADHFNYMCRNGGDKNSYYHILNPFLNAEEAYTNYKNAVTDFEIRLIQKGLSDIKSIHKTEHSATLYSSIF